VPRLSAGAKEQRRAALLDAAWRCIARNGYRNLRVDAVCAEAGVSKGAFYTYFDQKQDLLLALFDDDASRLDDVVADASSRLDGVDQLRQFIARMIERGSDAAAVQLRADLWAELASDATLRDRFLVATQARRARLAELIKQAVDAGDLVDVPANALASIFVALSDGLMLHRAIDPGGFRWANVRRALDVVLDGVRPDDVA